MDFSHSLNFSLFWNFLPLLELLGLLEFSRFLSFLPLLRRFLWRHTQKSRGELHFVGAASKLLFPEIVKSCRVKDTVGCCSFGIRWAIWPRKSLSGSSKGT